MLRSKPYSSLSPRWLHYDIYTDQLVRLIDKILNRKPWLIEYVQKPWVSGWSTLSHIKEIEEHFTSQAS